MYVCECVCLYIYIYMFTTLQSHKMHICLYGSVIRKRRLEKQYKFKNEKKISGNFIKKKKERKKTRQVQEKRSRWEGNKKGNKETFQYTSPFFFYSTVVFLFYLSFIFFIFFLSFPIIHHFSFFQSCLFFSDFFFIFIVFTSCISCHLATRQSQIKLDIY